MKELIKQILIFLHISVTKNQRYDALTRKILAKVLEPASVCVDIGCHKGEILDLMLKHSPGGHKYGFEPIPELFHDLQIKYQGNGQVTISPVAVYDQSGKTSFQHVLNAPAYSGIKKRKYSKKEVDIEQITVDTACLDDLIPASAPVKLIKIDVEGAEFRVLKGARRILSESKPLVIFEFGLGAADYYDSSPVELYRFIHQCGLQISTLSNFLKGHDVLTEKDFNNLYNTGTEYYFIAHP